MFGSSSRDGKEDSSTAPSLEDDKEHDESSGDKSNDANGHSDDDDDDCEEEEEEDVCCPVAVVPLPKAHEPATAFPEPGVALAPNFPVVVNAELEHFSDLAATDSGTKATRVRNAREFIHGIDQASSLLHIANLPATPAEVAAGRARAVVALNRAAKFMETTKILVDAPREPENQSFGMRMHRLVCQRHDLMQGGKDSRCLAGGTSFETKKCGRCWAAHFALARFELGKSVAEAKAMANDQLKNMVAKKFGMLGSEIVCNFRN